MERPGGTFGAGVGEVLQGREAGGLVLRVDQKDVASTLPARIPHAAHTQPTGRQYLVAHFLVRFAVHRGQDHFATQFSRGLHVVRLKGGAVATPRR
jgi:hypothetical protein